MALFVPYKPSPEREQPRKASMPKRPAPPVPFAPPRPGEKTATAHWSRCPHCFISISTIGTDPPTVCPYCRRALDQTVETRAMAEAVQPPSKEEVAQRIHNIYHRPHMILACVLGAIAILILGWAVVEQLSSLDEFWYKNLLIGFYSIIAGLFVITRFLFAAFYHAPREVGFEPTVTVLVPCYNEGVAIRKTIERIFSSGYPNEKLEVVCVNDGSKDDSLAHMLAAQTRHPHLVVVNFEKNRGLCHGWGVGTFLARGEFMVCVDSDTFVFPGSLHKLMQGFVDPTVGGISGHCDIENANVNTLTRLQDVRYYFSYKIMKAAESVFGVVSCLPGCFSAYRRTCVLAVMDKWINATVLGEHGNFADDRSLTNQILRDYRIIYDDQALATTICPENWRQYIRQQARWERSYLREIWKTGKFIWRKNPLPALSWYAMMWMPIVEPFVMLEALVILPVQAFLKTPAQYTANLNAWTAGRLKAALAGADVSAGFMGDAASKMGYSILKAMIAPETIVAFCLVFATLLLFYREATTPTRKRLPGTILALASFGFFVAQTVLLLRDVPLLVATVSPEYIKGVFSSSVCLASAGLVALPASFFMEGAHGSRRWGGWGLVFLLLLYLFWKTAAVMPPNMEPGNIIMPVFYLSEALLVPRTFLIGVMAITAVWSLHFLATTGRQWWRAGFAFTISYILFFSWQIYWAMYTIRGKAWGTRG